MKITCVVEMEYDDRETAKNILRAVKVDDQGFVESRRKKNTITAKITVSSVPSLLHTLDDYLACLSIAEHVVNKH
ncbi:MAG TPA: hypothetical protein EYP23_05025 [Thermoplasmata archaeon]|nr:hypothetical protein [Thermoplasmata archaeon]